MIPFFNIPSWALYAILTASVLAFTGWQGYLVGAAKLDRYKAEQATEAVRINTARQAITGKADIRYVKVAGKTEYVTRWVEKEVNDYENTGYCLDADWGRVHERAAANAISQPASVDHAALPASARFTEGRSSADRR